MSSVMQTLAIMAHGHRFCDQTSSAHFDEISQLLSAYHLKANHSLLDLGCGNGTFSSQIAKHHHCFVRGVDNNTKLIELAQDNIRRELFKQQCQFQYDDFLKLDTIHDASFDYMIAIGSLYWTQNLASVIELWKQKLVQNGKLILFQNMQYETLTELEKSDIENTVFIDIHQLLQILEQLDLEILEQLDKTDDYLSWLNRWCDGMNLLKANIYLELGETRGKAMIKRFLMYQSLAKQKKVRRLVMVLNKK